MKIFDRDSVNIQKPQSGRTTELNGGKTHAAAPLLPSVEEDQVDVSTQSQLQSLAASLGEQSRSGRVEQLRSLIQSGNYQIDFSGLSGALINGMLQGG